VAGRWPRRRGRRVRGRRARGHRRCAGCGRIDGRSRLSSRLWRRAAWLCGSREGDALRRAPLGRERSARLRRDMGLQRSQEEAGEGRYEAILEFVHQDTRKSARARAGIGPAPVAAPGSGQNPANANDPGPEARLRSRPGQVPGYFRALKQDISWRESGSQDISMSRRRMPAPPIGKPCFLRERAWAWKLLSADA